MMPPGMPVAPPPVSMVGPTAPTTCEGVALASGRGVASRRCVDCLCESNPMATQVCTRDCWTLAFCAAEAGCAIDDVECIGRKCNATGDANMNIAILAAQLAFVPFAECSAECFGDPETRPPAQTTCSAPRAEPASAVVGESIELKWDETIGDGEYTLGVLPWATVGSLREVDGRTHFRCDAPGQATITLDSDRCDNAPLALTVECTAPADSSCCPIEPLAEVGRSCSELGGSPPCHVGCGCLREGGVFYTELDAQGCLQWVLRPSLDSDEYLVCLDEAGDPSPDPRHTP